MLLFAGNCEVTATIQIPDRILIEGDTFNIHCFENHFTFSTRLEAAISSINGNWESTGCYRGYITTWELIGDELYLLDIIITKDSSDLKCMTEEATGRKFVEGKMRVKSINAEFNCHYNSRFLFIPKSEKEYKMRVVEGYVVEKTFIQFNNCNNKLENEIFLNYIYENINWTGIGDDTIWILGIVEFDHFGEVVDFKKDNDFYFDENLFCQIKTLILNVDCLQNYTFLGELQREVTTAIRFNDELKERYWSH